MNKKLLETLLKTDAYKVAHRTLYPKGLTKVFSNFTPRSGNWANPNLGFVVADGMRYVINSIREEFVDGVKDTLKADRKEVAEEYGKFVEKMLGVKEFDTTHILELLDYIKKHKDLPLEFRAVEEGKHVKYKTPILTVTNTDDKFAWVVNYLETWISSELWPIVTASTTAYAIKEQLLHWANVTGTSDDFVTYQAHDFSFRGMEGSHGAKLVGIGHLQHFLGSDNIPAILETGKGNSVTATEHSIMSAGTKEGEFETYKRLIDDNQDGILSIVSDTWNIYNVCNNILPKLKEKILHRKDGFVIRPDSGDAIKVMLGGQKLSHPNATRKDRRLAKKGLFKIIEKKFGYTKNDNGFKVLPISFLWGDGMTPEKINELFKAMAKEGYASENMSIGVGSYAYQLQTRDTHGFAMKATYVEINGKGYDISKDPITDSGVKKSAVGLLALRGEQLIEGATWKEVESRYNDIKKIK